MRRATVAAGVTPLLFSILLLGAAAVHGQDAAPGHAAILGAVAGIGFDHETGEASPTRALLGLELESPRLRGSLVADCGIPWEPSAMLALEVLLLDLDLVRIGLDARLWMRAFADVAVERGATTGVGIELGPRRIALAAAGGLGTRATRFTAIGDVLEDVVPWARLGVVARPVDAARFGLAIGSDTPLALWLRTSFELSGSWRFPRGIRVDGLVAARYSDFFTLTAHLDGFDARLSVFLPVAGGSW